MSTNDDDVSVELLRVLAGAGGQPTDDLLRRLAETFAAVVEENERLRATISQLEAREARAPAPAAARTDADELAHALLAAAQRAARELRESTRQQCELMLRKTSSRSRRLERDLASARASAAGELEALETLRREVRDRMRSSLETLSAILPGGDLGPAEGAGAPSSSPPEPSLADPSPASSSSPPVLRQINEIDSASGSSEPRP